MWSPTILPTRYHYIVDFNPFAQFMALFRSPLLGGLPSNYALFTTLGLTVLGIFSALIIFSRYRARIAYWL
jgi:ABC-type polysaccharide/polyol phosphate export permease